MVFKDDLGDSSRIVANREELTDICGDFFMFLHHTDEKDRNILGQSFAEVGR